VSYVDLATIHVPSTGGVAPAAWGLQIRENQEFMIDPPACSVFNTTTQNVGTTAFSVMLATSENYDNDGMHSTVSNTGRITAQTAGRYLFAATIAFGPTNLDSNVALSVSLLVNGTTRLDGVGGNLGNGAVGSVATVVRTVVLSAGQYVESEAWHADANTIACTLREFSALYMTR
jgi:hypothetical protein